MGPGSFHWLLEPALLTAAPIAFWLLLNHRLVTRWKLGDRLQFCSSVIGEGIADQAKAATPLPRELVCREIADGVQHAVARPVVPIVVVDQRAHVFRSQMESVFPNQLPSRRQIESLQQRAAGRIVSQSVEYRRCRGLDERGIALVEGTLEQHARPVAIAERGVQRGQGHG